MSEGAKARRPAVTAREEGVPLVGDASAASASTLALVDNRPISRAHAQLRTTIDASPRTRAVAQQQALASPPLRTATPSSSAPIQRVIDFSADVERQYTKDAYLTKLMHVSHLSFDEIRRTWIAAEASTEHITLPDNIEMAWAKLAPFQPPTTSASTPVSTPKRRGAKASTSLPQYPEDDANLLDKAASAIPMTSRFDAPKHRTAIGKHAKTIFPYAREESDEARQPWNPEKPGKFEERLPAVDFTTWDNLELYQKETLLENRSKPGVLMDELKWLLSEAPDKGNDYVIALYSHLAALRGDARAVGAEAGFADHGAYVQKIVDIRSGKGLESDTYKPRNFSQVSSIDWTKNKALIEDHPFLRQRREQVYRHLDPKEDKNALDMLTKWASPATGVQKNNAGMDDRIATKSQTPKHAGDDIALLDSTLARIAPIEGTLYAAYPRNDSLAPGHLFSQGTPLSASESAGGTVAFSKSGMTKKGGQIDRYRIYAKGMNGIPISPVAPDIGHGQREVVFRASATFKVLTIEQGNFGAGATRLVTMVEQGESTSQIDAVKRSQDALINRNDRWLTQLGDTGIDQRTQSWFISNSTGGTVEGQRDASFAFPYGKKTAQAWHDVITDNGIDIWSVDGFRTVAARLSGKTSSGVEFIAEDDEPSFWGAPVKLTPQEQENLKAHGLSVTEATEQANKGLFNVSYQQDDKVSGLGELLARSKQEFDKILAPKSKGRRNVGSGTEKEIRIAKLAARVQQQISVLHPLHDANGRVSRAYAYLILRRAGYGDKPLRLFDQDKDQTTSPTDWENQFADYRPGPETQGKRSPSTVPLTDMDSAYDFIGSLAGGNMAERLQEVDAEEKALISKSDVDDADMWVEEELLALALHLPSWLQPQFGQEMAEFVQAYYERQEAERRESRKKKERGHVEPSTKPERYAAAIALKRRLTIAISREIQKELKPNPTPKQTTTTTTITPIPKRTPKQTPKQTPTPKPKPKSTSLNRKRTIHESLSEEETLSDTDDDEAHTPMRGVQHSGGYDLDDEESEDYDDPKDLDYEPKKTKKTKWSK